MEASELRIGNLLFTHEDKLTEVTDIIRNINKNDIFWCFNYNMNQVKPIPLTEEWLIKLGFKGRIDLKWKGNTRIHKINDKYYFTFKDLSNVLFHSIIECKYVHQLQNLYFALTGEELKINL